MPKTREEMEDLNRDHARRCNLLIQNQGESWWERRRALDDNSYRCLLGRIPQEDRGRVLELGANSGGAFPSILAMGFWTVEGVDILPENVELGRNRGRDIRLAQMEDLGIYRAGEFDNVISRHTLEHTSDPKRTVAEIWRVLRPGGWAAHVVPAFAGSEREPAHLTNWGVGDWRQSWTAQGFRVEFCRVEDAFAGAELHMVCQKPG